MAECTSEAGGHNFAVRLYCNLKVVTRLLVGAGPDLEVEGILWTGFPVSTEQDTPLTQ